MTNIQKLAEQLSTPDVDDIITQLRDSRFSNIGNRIEFLKLILPLALSTDKKARKIIKAMGDLMSTLGDELLDSGDIDIDVDAIVEDEFIDVGVEDEFYEYTSKFNKFIDKPKKFQGV